MTQLDLLKLSVPGRLTSLLEVWGNNNKSQRLEEETEPWKYISREMNLCCGPKQSQVEMRKLPFEKRCSWCLATNLQAHEGGDGESVWSEMLHQVVLMGTEALERNQETVEILQVPNPPKSWQLTNAWSEFRGLMGFRIMSLISCQFWSRLLKSLSEIFYSFYSILQSCSVFAASVLFSSCLMITNTSFSGSEPKFRSTWRSLKKFQPLDVDLNLFSDVKMTLNCVWFPLTLFMSLQLWQENLLLVRN